VPPTDASTGAGTASTPARERAATGPGSAPGAAAGPGPGCGLDRGPDCEDTLDLRLSEEFLELRARERPGHTPGPATVSAPPKATTAPTAPTAPAVLTVRPALLPDDDLLGRIPDWGATTTPVGVFRLVPVDPGRDLPLISRWMNDPAVAVFWDLAGDPSVTERHLRAQLDGDGRSVPCLGVLDGTPMSYWEIYRADLDPLARHYPARPHDTGIHLLIGGVADRGRGLGSALLRSVADLVLDRRPSCARVVAEPDLRNTPSIAAFLSAGFRFSAEVDLPDKRAALMVRDRALRHLL
jgi:RimJ/RimL family protein N-acetyltransferase